MKKIYSFYTKNPVTGFLVSCVIIAVLCAAIKKYNFRHLDANKGDKVVRILTNASDYQEHCALLESGKIISLTSAEYHYLRNH